MPCKLTPIPDSPDFNGPTGEKVTVVTKNHIGTVMIAHAEYAGQQLVPDGTAVSSIDFTVVADRKTLKLVCVFTAGTAGRGELREQNGPDSQFLRDLPGHEPFQSIRIIGK